MSDDKLDRRIEFLVEQEAKLFARLETLTENVEKLTVGTVRGAGATWS